MDSIFDGLFIFSKIIFCVVSFGMALGFGLCLGITLFGIVFPGKKLGSVTVQLNSHLHNHGAPLEVISQKTEQKQ